MQAESLEIVHKFRFFLLKIQCFLEKYVLNNSVIGSTFKDKAIIMSYLLLCCSFFVRLLVT